MHCHPLMSLHPDMYSGVDDIIINNHYQQQQHHHHHHHHDDLYYELTDGSDVSLFRLRVDFHQMSALIAAHAPGCPPIHAGGVKAIPVTIPHVTTLQPPEKSSLSYLLQQVISDHNTWLGIIHFAQFWIKYHLFRTALQPTNMESKKTYNIEES